MNYYVSMFGYWNKSSLYLNIDDLNSLQSKDLRYKNTCSILKEVKTQFRKQLQHIGTIGIFEIYKASDEWFHIIFDVDEVKDEEQYLECMAYFNSLVPSLGKFSIGGYTKDIKLAKKYKIPLNKDAIKFFSAHVVFYEKKASLELVKKLFRMKKIKVFDKETNKEQTKTVFVNEGLRFQDTSIWEPILNGKGRLMRIAISDKVGKDGNEIHVKSTAGSVFDVDGNMLPNSSNLIKITGDEVELTEDDLKAAGIVFHDDENKSGAIQTKSYKRLSEKSKNVNMDTLNEIDIDSNLIKMDLSDLEQLLEHITDGDTNDRTYQLGQSVVSNLANSAHVFTNKDELWKVIYNWYNAENQSRVHTSPDGLSNFLNCYYGTSAPSNSWYFGLIKLIDDKNIKNEYNLRFAYNLTVCENVCINDAPDNVDERMCIEDIVAKIKAKKYIVKKDIDEENKEISIHTNGLFQLINDLKQCVGFCDGLYYIQTKAGLKIYSRSQICESYINKPFGVNVNVRVCDIIIKYIDYFTYVGVDFTKDNKEDVINMFRGWHALDIPNEKGEELIKKITYYLTGEDEKVADNFRAWLSFILRNPGERTEVAYTFQSVEGVGKGSIIDALELIFGEYCRPNISHMEDMTGDNNSVIEGASLVIGNELQSVKETKFKDWDIIKTLITDKKQLVGEKYVKKHWIKNTLNLMRFSNNMVNQKISRGDRRHMVCKCSDELKNDFTFWNDFHSSIKKTEVINGMFSYLLHFLDNQPNYRPSEHLIETDIKREIMNVFKSPIEEMLDNCDCETYDRLVKGFPRTELDDFRPSEYKNSKFFRPDIMKYLKYDEMEIDGKIVKTFRLTPTTVKQLDRQDYVDWLKEHKDDTV